MAAIIVAVVRLSCYYKEDLAKDLAKLLPFTLLAIALLNQNFFDLEKILNNISALPSFFNKIIIYLALIIALEIILRFFDFIFSLFGLEEVNTEVNEQETNDNKEVSEQETNDSSS